MATAIRCVVAYGSAPRVICSSWVASVARCNVKRCVALVAVCSVPLAVTFALAPVVGVSGDGVGVVVAVRLVAEWVAIRIRRIVAQCSAAAAVQTDVEQSRVATETWFVDCSVDVVFPLTKARTLAVSIEGSRRIEVSVSVAIILVGAVACAFAKVHAVSGNALIAVRSTVSEGAFVAEGAVPLLLALTVAVGLERIVVEGICVIVAACIGAQLATVRKSIVSGNARLDRVPCFSRSNVTFLNHKTRNSLLL